MNRSRSDEMLCDNCDNVLIDEDFKVFSWSYKCPHCGFEYDHKSNFVSREQVYYFNNPTEKP
jgi:DNA-directed RNA polymerase subunit M/transcription elongation factor TFIIS